MAGPIAKFHFVKRVNPLMYKGDKDTVEASAINTGDTGSLRIEVVYNPGNHRIFRTTCSSKVSGSTCGDSQQYTMPGYSIDIEYRAQAWRDGAWRTDDIATNHVDLIEQIAAVTVTVKDTDTGAGISNAKVEFGDQFVKYTDGSGRVTGQSQYGTHGILVTKSGYAPKSASVNITGSTFSAIISISKKMCEQKIKVTDTKGNPVSGARVVISGPTNHTLTTFGDGYTSYATLQKGVQYTAKASHDQYECYDCQKTFTTCTSYLTLKLSEVAPPEPEKEDTKISIEISDTKPPLNTHITISGIVKEDKLYGSQPVPAGTVKLWIDDWERDTVSVSPDGSYSFDFLISSTDQFTIHTAYMGTGSYNGSISSYKDITPESQITLRAAKLEFTMDACPTSGGECKAKIGSLVRFATQETWAGKNYCRLTDKLTLKGIPDRTIYLYYKKDGIRVDMTQTATGADGTFTASWTPAEMDRGKQQVYAEFKADPDNGMGSAYNAVIAGPLHLNIMTEEEFEEGGESIYSMIGGLMGISAQQAKLVVYGGAGVIGLSVVLPMVRGR